MDRFSEDVIDAVNQFKRHKKMTNSDLALSVGLRKTTIDAKLTGVRNWTLQDLRKLAGLGVEIPPLLPTDSKEK